jgi:hypothetical protein
MENKKEKRTQPEAPAATGGMSPALWLVPGLAILALLFYLALTMGYIAPTLLTMVQWKWTLIILQFVFIAILVSSHALDKRAAPVECEPAEVVSAEIVDEKPAAPPKARPRPAPAAATVRAQPAAAPRPAVATAPAAPEGKPEIVEYPEKISGGIYADTHLPIGDGRFLKLRTLIARSCLLCDEHDTCFAIVRHDMSAEGFNSNIDCKQGLNIEVTRA